MNSVSVPTGFSAISMAYLTDRYLNALQRKADGDGAQDHPAFGIPALDRLLRMRSGLTVIASRPSQGKTSLAVAAAMHTGIELSLTTLVVCQDPLAFLERCVAHAGIDLLRLRQGRLESQEWSRLSEQIEKLRLGSLTFSNASALHSSFSEISDNLSGEKEELKFVVVDCPEELEIDSSVENLRQWAFEIPVLATATCAQAVDWRVDKQPHLDDIDQELERASECVVTVVRKAYYSQDGLSPSAIKAPVSFRILRQRHGPTVSFDGEFEIHSARFVNSEAATGPMP